MDDLMSLPLKEDAALTPAEAQVMERFFSPRDGGATTGSSLTLVGYATLLFIALGNPWIDVLLDKIPWLNGSWLCVFAVKILLFMIVLFVLQRWFV